MFEYLVYYNNLIYFVTHLELFGETLVKKHFFMVILRIFINIILIYGKR